MDKEWIEYLCKSGQLMFLYNKVTGEHKWPHELGPGVEGKIIYGRPVTYKEFCTSTTQTDDNGCTNGCMSMYVDTHPGLASNTGHAKLLQDLQPGVLHVGEEISLNDDPAVGPCTCNVFIKQEPRDEQQDGQQFESSYENHELEGDSENTLTDTDYQDSKTKSKEVLKMCDQYSDNQIYDDGNGNVHDGGGHDNGDDHGTFLISEDENIVSNDENNHTENSESITDVSVPRTEGESQEKLQHKKTFKTNSTIDRHIKMKHFHCKNTSISHQWLTNGKEFQCDVCKKLFSYRSHLYRHAIIHTGVKLFKCTVCTKTFGRKDSLTLHARIHTGVKPFECTVCKKRFVLKGNLAKHSRIHTGEKPFECTVCKKTFARKCSLFVHSRTHTGVKPFQCTVCKKTFAQKGNLTQHARTHWSETK